jgi:hypothetical protein
MKSAGIAMMASIVSCHPDADRRWAVLSAHVPVNPGLTVAALAIAEKTQHRIIEGARTPQIRDGEVDMVNPSAHD